MKFGGGKAEFPDVEAGGGDRLNKQFRKLLRASIQPLKLKLGIALGQFSRILGLI